MKRHKELSIRSPEPTSIQRAQGFNRAKVQQFFNVLRMALCDENGTITIPAENVYNADESGFSICHKPKKIIAKCGKRGVGALTSAEKGRNITVMCCMSAAGHFLPPFFLFLGLWLWALEAAEALANVTSSQASLRLILLLRSCVVMW